MQKRIQRKRVKGWRMPENCVYVGRPTKWGNPLKFHGGMIELRKLPLQELKGKDLACWCKLDEPCHADILLKHLCNDCIIK